MGVTGYLNSLMWNLHKVETWTVMLNTSTDMEVEECPLLVESVGPHEWAEWSL